ncbi:protein MCM10 homolog isoform X1 [Panicum virgatum]|uniref:Zinc finger Mcm10/DnaG-type domain-containing protein n=1 Tax=Panicum virgatum TaxID=38727 RepID=A0A8T0WI63_PANVG|nr:protein MCM10 homolog isoform X1 [Panicum virgatum]KAG2644914.1 hypothetical protein PVAP13_2KG385900 [Panicum virgatum]
MASAADDLDLLLSLGEAVPETPPTSPRAADGPESGGAFTPPRTARPGGNDMSVFRDAVKDYLEAAPESTSPLPERPKRPKATETLVDKYSGLRIKHLMLSPLEISNRFADIRFVRITAIKNSVGSERFSGCWATAGVLLDKGVPRVSAKGTSYGIWKMGALDETEVSLFLFGDAHVHYSGAAVGSVFAIFNGNVRMDNVGKGFSVSVASVGQMLKMGVAADFGLCKGKRKDGVACTMAINKSTGAYCKFHSSKTSQKYTTGRVELKGGNFQFASKLRSEGIYMVNPSSERPNPRKPCQPVKVMSIDGLKRALSNADRVTTKNQSQGIRFLSHVTANMDNKKATVKGSGSTNQQKSKYSLNKSSASSGAKEPPKQGLGKPEQDIKRRKVNNPPGNIVELDAVSSDDDEINIVLQR